MRVLALSVFPALPSRYGGPMRVHYLLSALADRGVQVRLLCPVESRNGRSRVTVSDGIVQTEVPTGWRFAIASRRFVREPIVSRFDLALARYSDRLLPLRREIDFQMEWADIVLCHQPYLYPLVRNAKIPVVLDAMDIEADLKGDRPRTVDSPGNGGDGGAWDDVRALEFEALTASAGVLAMSAQDAARLECLYGIPAEKVHEVGNARPTEIVPYRPPPEQRQDARFLLGLDPDRPVVLFFGSGHPPNVDAARLILKRIAPCLPEAEFVIAGGLSYVLKDESCKGNVTLRFETYGEERELLYRAADLAINPVTQRLPGSDIKVLDTLAHGVPLVATALGVRGFGLLNGFHYYPLDRDWAKDVERVLRDEQLANHLAHHGLARARELGWERRGEALWCVLNNVIEHRPSLPSPRPVPAPPAPPSTPEDNARLALKEFTRGSETVTSTPAELIFDLTNACVLQCVQCYRNYMDAPKVFMPLEVFDRVPCRYFDNALQIDLSGIGESMLHPQWDEILERVAGGGNRFVSFNTSLTLTNEHRLRRMVELGTTVTVSIDGATKETYERIRRGASHAAVFGAMARLTELNGNIHHPRFNLRILWTLSALNLHELPLLPGVAHELGIRELHVHPLIDYFPSLTPWVCDPNDPEFVDTLLRAYAEARAQNIRLDITSHLLLDPALREAVKENEKVEYPNPDTRWHHHLPDDNGCSFPWTQLNFDSQGTIVSCCFADYKMGNVLTQDLDEIWNGFRYARMRRDLSTIGCSAYCTDCPSGGGCCPRIQSLQSKGVIPKNECSTA